MTTKVPPSMIDGDSLLAVVPIGATIDYYGATPPSEQWLFPYGQDVSRTAYPVLFERLGTRYGVGDGSTTFGLPDLRGRVGVGKDNMGGTPANRVTTAVSGVDAATLGAVGGSQLLHQHTHSITDPGHVHDGAASAGPDLDATLGAIATAAEGGNTGSSTTGITIQNAGTGNSQNVQPSIVCNKLIRVL